MALPPLRLGINVDHVATVRNARGGLHPCPVQAALLARAAGADGITAHLREDRRHIRDADIRRLKDEVGLPLNFEMAATAEMRDIALATLPHAACLVPEKREELTTEGGLDVRGHHNSIAPVVRALADAGIRVSLFVEADPEQLRAAVDVGAAVVELHSGAYCDAPAAERPALLKRLRDAAALTAKLGLECHVGHGLTYDTVGPVAAIPEAVELNIGHFLIGEAIFTGLEAAIRRMRAEMDAGRAGAEPRAGGR
ncbi:MAG: pyridoxine 5'-phosphate synthase [Alphaproteobacteria bacterium]|nr:pyridoxine 5'-phosphate synthase [Alphaproteobacteria bacterium]MCB9931694.1 pyridoxine 5'-phosphate synthase [Alphaproteobacteria bacterium]